MEIKNVTISCKVTKSLRTLLVKSAEMNDVRLSTEIFNRLLQSFKRNAK